MPFCRMILIISFSILRGKQQVKQNYPFFSPCLSLWEIFPFDTGALPDFFCCRQRLARSPRFSVPFVADLGAFSHNISFSYSGVMHEIQ